MGEHLKGKLQGMIRQRFENYLHIIKLWAQPGCIRIGR